MAAFSMDLRERVVAACDEGLDTRAEVAERFRVSESWIRRLLQRRRATGSIAAKPRGGDQPPAFDARGADRLREAVAADPDATLKELAGAGGITCSTSAVDRAAGDHAPKKSTRAAEQDRPELKALRAARREEFAAVDPSRLAFLDESGATTTMARRHGRAPRGERVDAAVPHGHWKVITLTAAIGVGVGACPAFDGATNTACFETYVERCLVPTLRPGDIVIMDNLSCHKTAEVERLIRSADAGVRYLPPYSPDLNPIEEMFSKFKEFLRSVAARQIDDLIGAMGDALRAVTPEDILGWFGHCGYRYGRVGTALGVRRCRF